jgi:signal transduction histidine kinase
MQLARLEAGQERREIISFDAAALISDLCQLKLPLARERNLYLNTEGPAQLLVSGDSGKVRRLTQNLLLNALKYTMTGGVTVNWGEEKENWWLMVKDTGPGIMAGPGAPMLMGLKEATASAREADEKVAEAKGEVSHVLTSPESTSSSSRPPHMQAGEGIGLSIVKRLCELLDASLEIASSPKPALPSASFSPAPTKHPQRPPAASRHPSSQPNARQDADASPDAVCFMPETSSAGIIHQINGVGAVTFECERAHMHATIHARIEETNR